MKKNFIVLAIFACHFSIGISQNSTYYTAHYETGGHIRVVRDRELGTAAQQAAVGRVAGPAGATATEAAQRSQLHGLRDE
jgi:hypothetical protein